MTEQSRALPAWMYDDPAEVVQRKQQAEINKAMRAAKRLAEEHRARFGMVSQGTVRKINQQRIRQAMRGNKP